MKDKIVFFAIGFLVGAIISTTIFYVYTLANKSQVNTNPSQINTRQKMEKSNGDMSTPPQMPSDSNSKSTNKNSDTNETTKSNDKA